MFYPNVILSQKKTPLDLFVHKSMRDVSNQLVGKEKIKEAFQKIRQTVHEKVKYCKEDVSVIIYADDVLEQPVTYGTGRNRLMITIESEGQITFDFTDKTWTTKAKEIFASIFEEVKKIVKEQLPGITVRLLNVIPSIVEKKVKA